MRPVLAARALCNCGMHVQGAAGSEPLPGDAELARVGYVVTPPTGARSGAAAAGGGAGHAPYPRQGGRGMAEYGLGSGRGMGGYA